MSINDDEIRLLKQSFAKIAKMRVQAGTVFYNKLFEIAPDVRPMFKSDFSTQAAKLIDMLGLAVGMLRSEHLLVKMLQGLGERHSGYGTRPEHFERVGEALEWTIVDCLGSQCTPAVRAAWLALYSKAADIMITAMIVHARKGVDV